MRIPGYLRTRVARRMLALFLACALLPLTLLAILGYRHVSDEIEERTRQQLRADSKAAGMLVIDRIAVLADGLSRMDPDHLLRSYVAGDSATVNGPRFRALTLEHADGLLEPLVGTWRDLPPLSQRATEQVENGRVGLTTDSLPDRIRVSLVRKLPDGSRLWGWVLGRSVWTSTGDRGVVTGDSQLCLVDDLLRPLNCNLTGAIPVASASDDGHMRRWRSDSIRYVAGRWTVFLGYEYAAPSWTAVVSVPEARVFAPLASLRVFFLMGLALALATVFAFSHIQLRRQTAPLETLQAATERIAAGDFDHPVTVASDDEFAALGESFNRMATDLGHQFRLQEAFGRVHRAALGGAGPGPLLQAIFENAGLLIPGNGIAVALARPDDPFWWRVNVVCRSDGPCAPRDVQPTEAELAEIGRQPQGFVARRGERGRSYFGNPGAVLMAETLVLPLRRQGTLDGVLVVPCRAEQEGRPEVLVEARRAADQLAVAIANTQLVEQLDALSWGTLTALARTIDAVSPWTAGHSERVTLGALEIGRRLGVTQEDLALLHRGGLLHDIGKVGVPAGILDKPGALTPEELLQIQQHPSIGARILAPIGAVRKALPLVLHHHELLDGSGYPHGLAGDQIPPLVRILTVADVFDALTSDRPYRAAWTVERAIGYLRESAGVKFDPTAVEALGRAIAEGYRPATEAADGESILRGSGRFTLWPERTSGSGTAPPSPVSPTSLAGVG